MNHLYPEMRAVNKRQIWRNFVKSKWIFIDLTILANFGQKQSQLGGIYDFDEFFAIFVTARIFGHISWIFIHIPLFMQVPL